MPDHRLRALRFALVMVIVWCIAALARPPLALGFLTGAIIFAGLALLMTNGRLMDSIENKER